MEIVLCHIKRTDLGTATPFNESSTINKLAPNFVPSMKNDPLPVDNNTGNLEYLGKLVCVTV